MYKKILVPLDGSGRAEAILPYVEDLAHRFGSSVIFLEVLEPLYEAVLTPDPAVERYVAEADGRRYLAAQTYLNGRCGEFRERNIDARTIIVPGSAVSTIAEVAAQEDVDLIAMASHGRTGLTRVFYGSVAAGVLHRADRPLLLIRAEN